MNTKIKKIIAREGLILLAIIFLATIIYFMGTHTTIKWEQYRVEPEPNFILRLLADGSLGFVAGFCGYSLYLLIRFIIWAIRAIKQ